MKFIIFSICWLACATGSAMAAEAVPGAVYKWTDAKGLVHYGDRPAPSGEAARSEQALSKSNMSAGDNMAAQKELAISIRDGSQKQREDAEKISAGKEAATQAALRAKACVEAKEAQRTLAAGGRMAVVNEKGEKVFLEDAAIAERNINANKAVEEACSAPKPASSATATVK